MPSPPLSSRAGRAAAVAATASAYPPRPPGGAGGADDDGPFPSAPSASAASLAGVPRPRELWQRMQLYSLMKTAGSGLGSGGEREGRLPTRAGRGRQLLLRRAELAGSPPSRCGGSFSTCRPRLDLLRSTCFAEFCVCLASVYLQRLLSVAWPVDDRARAAAASAALALAAKACDAVPEPQLARAVAEVVRVARPPPPPRPAAGAGVGPGAAPTNDPAALELDAARWERRLLVALGDRCPFGVEGLEALFAALDEATGLCAALAPDWALQAAAAEGGTGVGGGRGVGVADTSAADPTALLAARLAASAGRAARDALKTTLPLEVPPRRLAAAAARLARDEVCLGRGPGGGGSGGADADPADADAAAGWAPLDGEPWWKRVGGREEDTATVRAALDELRAAAASRGR